jgi:hypothetical protein
VKEGEDGDVGVGCGTGATRCGGAIGGAVVGDQNPQPARIVLLDDEVEGLFLVEADDHHGGFGEGKIEAQRGRTVEQQRGDQIGVEVARDDRDAEDHGDR